MGGCQSNSAADSGKLQVEVLYCGGNTVKPYFDELCTHLEAQPFKEKISIRGRQDLMFTGRFEVLLHTSDGKKLLVHSKKNNEEHGWARKPTERQAICEKIIEELDKREPAQE